MLSLVDENSLLEGLPAKMVAELLIAVHYHTLSRVQLFQDCEKTLLYDLVVKLQPSLFLPQDYICKKVSVNSIPLPHQPSRWYFPNSRSWYLKLQINCWKQNIIFKWTPCTTPCNLKLYKIMKRWNFLNQITDPVTYGWMYISNLYNGAIIKHLMLHRMNINLMELSTAEVFGVRMLMFLQRFYCFHSPFSKFNYLI